MKFRSLITATSNRLRVKGVIYLLPGIHLRQIERILGISFHSTRYHVENLSQTGEIIREWDGRYSRLYPLETSEQDRTLFKMMHDKTTRRILGVLSSSGRLTNKQVSNLTGLAKSTVSERLQTLTSARIVRISLTEQGRITCERREPERVSRLLANSKQTMMSVATDRFLEMWDF